MDQFNTQIINSLTFLNWNANGLKEKRATFLAFMARHNVDVACITETHLVQNENFKIAGYLVYREDRVAPIASGGVAIFIKRRIAHCQIILPQLVALEAVSIKLFLKNGRTLNVISAYKPPNRRLRFQELQLIFSDDQASLLLGDLNSKSRAWGCTTANPSGNILLRFINESNCNIAAPDEPTHYPWTAQHRADILDIALFKNFTDPILQQVLPELDSDHLPVLVTFNLQLQLTSPPLKLITGPIDWDAFSLELDKSLRAPHNLNSSFEIDNAILSFTESVKLSVKKAIVKTFRKTTNNFMHPPLRILNLIKEKHRVRRQWQRNRLPDLRRQLNNLVRQVKYELDSFRLKSYESYVSEIDPADSNLWRATKRILRTPTIIPTLVYNDYSFQTDLEKCNVFADYYEDAFTPGNVIDDDTVSVVNETLNSDHVTAELPIKFASPSEIKSIINNLPNRKTPGHDLIPNSVLKHLTRKALAYLTSIINSCISKHYFPKTWKHAEVIVIHKPGKPKNSPTSYRPISLLCTLSKILEKILQKRLVGFIDSAGIIPPHQFGFRSKHSTVHQVLRITETIIRGFERKEHSAAAFLDISQAFDKVWHKGLLYKLSNFGFPRYIQKLIKSFLEERTFLVKLNSSKSTHRVVNAGVPQGSVLGPLLFNVYLSDIPIPVHSTLALYADDTAIIAQNSNLNEAIETLQTSIDTLSHWFNQWRFSLNPTKCESKVFSLKKFTPPPEILINNTEIQWNPEDSAVKYLGVLLDKKLNWNFHMNSKLNQAYARLLKLYPLINRKSKLKIPCATLLYKSILRPLIMYACPVWGLSLSQSKMNKIQIFQNKVLRVAVNAPWFVRNSQIHKELGIRDVFTFIRKSTSKFLLNIQETPGAVTFQIGQPTPNIRLNRRLPQDLNIDIV
jgi:endonuclease/exonuclease/phosphatase (EEP) superfamily protein YafD